MTRSRYHHGGCRQQQHPQGHPGALLLGAALVGTAGNLFSRRKGSASFHLACKLSLFVQPERISCLIAHTAEYLLSYSLSSLPRLNLASEQIHQTT
jgi:hypothetical protein